MLDWTHLLVNYWWMIAIGIAVVFVITRIHNFFRFFTTLISMVALFYAATIILVPPTDDFPTKEISNVLGVSTETNDENVSPVVESTESAEAGEESQSEVAEEPIEEAKSENGDECPETITSREDFQKCFTEWKDNLNFQIPGF